MTQFACVFSALIHDCEHDGVPNAQLVKEEHPIAAKYNNISVAEQNSVDVAWDILMQPRFQAFRSAIYTTEAEMIRFRQLVVNVSILLQNRCVLICNYGISNEESMLAVTVCYGYGYC